MLLQLPGPCPSFRMQGQRRGSTGSIVHVAHCVLRVALRHVAVAVAGITAIIAGAALTIVDHVTFIRRDHHRVVLEGEGPY